MANTQDSLPQQHRLDHSTVKHLLHMASHCHTLLVYLLPLRMLFLCFFCGFILIILTQILGLSSFLSMLTPWVNSSNCMAFNTIYIPVSPAWTFLLNPDSSFQWLSWPPHLESNKYANLRCLKLLLFPKPTSLPSSHSPISKAQLAVRPTS